MTGVLQASRLYAQSTAMTAGHLKSYQLLLEKAVLHIREARRGNLQARDRAQDIVAQVQSGMNLQYESSQQLFEMLGYVWDALEWNGKDYFDRAEDLIRQMRNLIVDVQHMHP